MKLRNRSKCSKKQRDIITELQSLYSQRKDKLTNASEAVALDLHGESLKYDDSALCNENTAINTGALPNLQFGYSGEGEHHMQLLYWGAVT